MLLAIWLFFAPSPAWSEGLAESAGSPPDSSAGLPIRDIRVVARNVYEPLPEGRLVPLYRLANRLHIRTRPGTVREQLLFARGDLWSPERARETERNLRALDFLTPKPIRATRDGDSVLVVVETRDIWSTTPEFDLESFEGQAFGSIAFTERNLLGLGTELSFTYREVPTGISRSFAFIDPGLAGSHARLRLSASQGSLGATDAFEIGIPFYSLDTPRAFQVSGLRTSSVASLVQGEAVAAQFDREVEQVEAWWGNGWRDGATVRRLVWSYRGSERRLGPSRLQPGAPPEFEGGREELKLNRIAVEGRIWRPHYLERTNVDRMHLVEDFEVGPSVVLGLGVSPRALGSTASEGYTRFGFDLGAELPVGFGRIRTDVSSRIRGRPVETIERVDARWVGQVDSRKALVLSAVGVRGSRTSREFQTVVGGLSGLRGYPIQAVAGRRLWRLNAEHRWTVRENIGEIVTIGAVVFTDAARAWGAGAAGTDWFVSSGAGLRLSLPQLSLGSLFRFDVAIPLRPARDGRHKPVLSIGSSQAF